MAHRCGRWDAAVLGDVAGLAGLLSEQPAPSGEDINGFFWGACHGGQRETAEYLRARGADVNWVGWDNLTPKGAARRYCTGRLAAPTGRQVGEVAVCVRPSEIRLTRSGTVDPAGPGFPRIVAGKDGL
jgi:hypothetical protein